MLLDIFWALSWSIPTHPQAQQELLLVAIWEYVF
jgi:hypothetical protein